MRIILDKSVLQPDAVDQLALLAVIQQCREPDRHFLVAAKEEFDRWRAQMPKNLSNAVETVLRSGATQRRSRSTPEVKIVAGKSCWRNKNDAGDDCPKLSPADAVRLLQVPLCVLVENARSDGAFIQRMSLGSNRERLERALRMGWLMFEQAGGLGEMTKMLDKIRNLDDAKPETWVRWLRLCVVFDRDAHEEDCTFPSEDSDKALEALNALRSTVGQNWPRGFRLERRAIENYLPKAGLESYVGRVVKDRNEQSRRKSAFDAYYHPQMNDPNGSDRLRASYCVPEGLNKDKKDTSHIYANLDDERKEALAKGFGKDVKHLWKEERPGLKDEWIERERGSAKNREIEGVVADILGRI